jgi:hypothetical protein
MRRFFSVALVFWLTASAAADNPKPNTLTTKEIEEGWILLWDGETTYGWRSPNDSQWTIADGMLAPQAGKEGLLVTTSPFGDYRLEFDFQRNTDSKPAVLVGCDSDGKKDPGETNRRIELQKSYFSGWATADVVVRNGQLQSFNYRTTGLPLAEFAAPTAIVAGKPFGAGRIALSGNGVVFRNIKLKPGNMDSLFNGKDLTGWKEFPGKKSKFSVTPDGSIHLEGGPGDLQSEGQWADFVLQLQCKSNGDHCNSGVFFRCRPGEFEQGYEAQIRNEFTDEPKQEYSIEEYDPQTHEKKDAKKVKYTAVDYGTGGIYRRMPARKQLSKDREWFDMTIAASGRHIAVWVNGVQATDWTDDRPASDNARKGCCLEKGAISLQGHEAAVEDLEFRGISIQDLTPPPGEKKP